MLDVHPVHNAPHTWREFLLHIATISVGLLIAIGLEQCVEFTHDMHQRHQLQEDLRVEALNNAAGIPGALVYLDGEAKRDLMAAQAVRSSATHSGASSQPYPPPFKVDLAHNRSFRFVVPSNAVWATAKNSGALARLPLADALTYTRLDRFHDLVTNADADWRRSNTALEAVEARFAASQTDPIPALGPLRDAQLDELSAAIMLAYANTKQLQSNLLYFRAGNQAVLNGLRDEDALASYMYNDHSETSAPSQNH